jgi:16S rRNA (cytosine967-C5)-methyltransferase
MNKVSPDELKEILESDGVFVETGAYLSYAFHIGNYNYLNDLNAFHKGYFQVQDESSMLVGAVSGIREGDYVIDVCAAPGGKSLHAADILRSTGHVSSRDVSDYKVNLIADNINRLGYTNITAKVQDALILDQESIEKADVLLADLPCSGLGIIGKKPDIKYNVTKEKQKELVRLQRDILEVVHQYVKKGGTFIYSTCTINPEENIENVRWFMKEYHFQAESLNPYLPEILWSDTTKEGYLQLIPGIHQCDGFFIARLRREH